MSLAIEEGGVVVVHVRVREEGGEKVGIKKVAEIEAGEGGEAEAEADDEESENVPHLAPKIGNCFDFLRERECFIFWMIHHSNALFDRFLKYKNRFLQRDCFGFDRLAMVD